MDSAAALHLDFAACDRARLARDPRFDGRFFIGVTSTGIYCRPICPAPTAKPKNIKYFPSAAAAAEAGFRPCLRCRPEAAPGTPAWLGTSATVRRALRLIHEGALDTESVEQLSSRLGIGPRHLHRLFVQHLGASPIAVAQTRRLHFAKHLIDETRLAMTDIALASGFGSLRRFNDAFRQTYGRAPRDLRRGQRGLDGGHEALRMRLAYRPPYDWIAIRDFLATRAIPGVESVQDDCYARSVMVAGQAGRIEVRPVRGATALELAVHGLGPECLFSVVSRVRQVFDLAADPADIRAVLKKDALLARALRKRPGLRVPGAWDPFELAVRAVLGQQVSVAAARTFATRIVAAQGVPLPVPAGGITHLFPSAQVLAEADLGKIGLTGARVATLNALAVAVRDGAINFDNGDEMRQALLKVPGIGPWTVEYIALRGLSDPDAFPAGDLVLQRMAGGPKRLTEKQLLARAERWRPWRAYAVLHLWRASSDVLPVKQDARKRA